MNRFCRIAIPCVCLSLLACAPKPTHSSDEDTAAALGLITSEKLLEHVAYLADDALEGREAGKSGYDDAANYVAEQFAAMGVEPGGTDGWYQSVALRGYKIDIDSATMIMHRDTDFTFTYRDHFAMSGDPLLAENSVRAGVVYVGFGVHAPDFGYSDYDNVDVRGKVVAVFDGAPETIEGTERAYYASGRTKSAEAVSRGALGVLGLRTRRREEQRPWDELKSRFGKRPQLTWLNEEGRAAGHYPKLLGGAILNTEAAELLFGLSPLSFEEALEANDATQIASVDLGVEVTLSRRTEHTLVKTPNVIGVVRGTDTALADEYVVFTAHLDHVGVRGEEEDKIHNGAYDNAMGVALMLETARAIAAAPPRRSVLFIALTAEEKGLLGSDYFVNNPTVPIESIVANINLDMPLFLYPVADLVAFGAEHSTLKGVVAASAAKENFTLSPDPIPEENLFVRSDQYSFVRLGVPAIYLVPGFTSTDNSLDAEALVQDHIENHYHEPSDDLTRPMDWDSALRFARANTRIGYAIATTAERPEWNEGDFFGRRYGRK